MITQENVSAELVDKLKTVLDLHSAKFHGWEDDIYVDAEFPDVHSAATFADCSGFANHTTMRQSWDDGSAKSFIELGKPVVITFPMWTFANYLEI
ncbi:hypothetical protein ACGFXC_24225 [Streptomyces sp. NPDC048507]|uniref:hypothetical protein n=1 Tax=Streptomyces sp. NPDC048507 TaxID=3365560 RepID=UPI003712F9E3